MLLVLVLLGGFFDQCLNLMGKFLLQLLKHVVEYLGDCRVVVVSFPRVALALAFFGRALDLIEHLHDQQFGPCVDFPIPQTRKHEYLFVSHRFAFMGQGGQNILAYEFL